MILEVAEIDILPGMEEAFAAGFAAAGPVFAQVAGWHGADLYRSIEHPSRFRLLARWDTVEDHTRQFRLGPAFEQWREAIGRFLAAPPRVEHMTLAGSVPVPRDG